MKTAHPLSLFFLALYALSAVASAAELPPKLKPLDRNADGKLSASEFPDQELFQKIDRNQDGFATVPEIRDYYTKNPPQPARKSVAAPAAPAAVQPKRSPEEVFA